MHMTPNCYFFAAGKIHNPFHFVRDFYFFKRSQYPQLSLVHKKPAEAYLELQEQAFKLKFAEMGVAHKVDWVVEFPCGKEVTVGGHVQSGMGCGFFLQRRNSWGS